MRKMIDRIMLRLFFNRKTRKVLQERRFDFLFVQLYACSTWEHMAAFRKCMERVLQPEDYKHIRFYDLSHETELVESHIINDEIRMQQLRIDYGDYILRQNGIK